MVTYNSSKYVRVAIESILASTYNNFELIISDDCSTDNTWQIISEYKDLRIKAYQNETNLREYANRNRCIDLASGEYFIFIDGDDYIYPHGVEQFIEGALINDESAMIISQPESDHMIYPVILTPEQYCRRYLFKKRTRLFLPNNPDSFRTDLVATYTWSGFRKTVQDNERSH
jgi:glycosyltransferase involved in cell wall biosynthesis